MGWCLWLVLVVSVGCWRWWLVFVLGVGGWCLWLELVVGVAGWCCWLVFVVGIWVIHTEVANLGASWSRFLAVTLMMVWVLVYGSYIQRWQIWVQAGHAFWRLLL